MASRRSAEQWAKLVKQWERSGLSAGKFAAREGLRADTLSWWRWRLGAARKRASAKKRRTTKRKKTAKANTKRRTTKRKKTTKASTKRRTTKRKKTAEAGPPQRFVQLVGSEIPNEAPIEIVLGDAIVRVRRGFDSGTLGRVLAVFADEEQRAC